MDSPPEPNRLTPSPPPTPPRPPSSQQSPCFFYYASNLSPLPQHYVPRHFASPNDQFVFSSSSQRRSVDQGNYNDDRQIQENISASPLSYIRHSDSYRMNPGFSSIRPGLMSDRHNLPNPSILRQRGNVNSEDVSPLESRNFNAHHVSRPSQLGSRIINADHVSRPYHQTFQHHRRRHLSFGTTSFHEGRMSNIRQLLSVLSRYNTNAGASANIKTLNKTSLIRNHVISRGATLSSSPNVFASGTLGMCRNSQEGQLVNERNNDLARVSDTNSACAVSGETSSLPNNHPSERRAIIKESFAPSTSIGGVVPLSGPMQVIHDEQQIVPCTASISALVHTNEVEELNQENPRRKRLKASNGDEKRKYCCCKKSGCLKIYCQCFAAEVYCSDSCTCQNCQNKIDNEETVLRIRSEIKSRNPHAFAPKEDGTLTTPSLAKHRKGCNCSKSKCAKKYCECFQAKVGCSLNCWCEDCQNSFGRKTEIAFYRAEILDEPSNGNTGSMSRIDCSNSGTGNTNQFPDQEGCHGLRNYTPSLPPSSIPSTTPSLAWHRKGCNCKITFYRAEILDKSSNGNTCSMSRIDCSNSGTGNTNQFPDQEGCHGLRNYTPSLPPSSIPSTEVKAVETSQPRNAVQASSPNQSQVQLPARLVQDMMVGNEIKAEETSQPSNAEQACSANQKHVLLPPADGPVSVANLQPGSRPDRELVPWNVSSPPSHLPS
ncbi:hypothetical protein L484_005134 [Morus notabilis]|uniref:CRC domain-containing protein n=1 Tax=Morus notabilis TaxID=981085 RepID=W9QQ43_9ROSA|nr:hypothetical protein L484_005134 [Morus notabilis]